MKNDLTRDRSTWLLAALLAFATLLVYVPTLSNGFVQFDDPGYVTDNPHVKSGLTARNIGWAFTTFEQGNWHPLTWISHMADCQFSGVNPSAHHAVSIFLHILNAVLLFFLLYSATGFRWRSFMVAALFALHPINVESVSWVAERKSLLCMFFSLITVALYGRFVRTPGWKLYPAVVAAFAAALMSKPMAVTLPALLLLLDYWPLDRFDLSSPPKDSRQTISRIVGEKLPLFLMSAVSSVVTIVAQRSAGAVNTLEAIPFSIRLENAAVSTVIYIRRLFWPNDLSSLYPHPGLSLPAWKAAFSVVLLLGLTLLFWRTRVRRYTLFGWAFFLVALLPVIGILQVGLQAMADRYAYLPYIGLFVIVVWGWTEFANMLRILQALTVTIAVVALGALSACTMKTERYWRTNLALFTRAHEMAPRPNLYIETNLAATLMDAGRMSEALTHFRLAESAAPRVFTPHYNVAYITATSGDFTTALTELHTAMVCTSDPKEKVRALNLLGMVFINMGDKPNALVSFQQSLAIQPGNRDAQAGMAELGRR